MHDHSKSFNGVAAPPEGDIMIMVMGSSGAGKSTFINLASGSDFQVGYGLASETKDVRTVVIPQGGRNIILVDTPGFDDTEISNVDTLRTIANWLEASYRRGDHLSGLIYLHRITDNRVGGISYKSIRLFQKLCGRDAMKNVVLCTTMWDLVEEKVGMARENQLASVFWKPMIDDGATINRHYGTAESAQGNLRNVSKFEPITLSIQRSLMNGIPLEETKVGREISKELLAAQERHMRELDEANKEMAVAIRENDLKAQQMLKEEQALLNERLEKETRQRQRLAASRTAEVAALRRTLDEMRDANDAGGFFCNLGRVLDRVFLESPCIHVVPFGAYAIVNVPYPSLRELNSFVLNPLVYHR